MAIPEIADGKTCFQVVCHRVAPNAREASRMSRGTERSASRVVMMITGRMSRARATEPASTTGPSEIGPRTTNANVRMP